MTCYAPGYDIHYVNQLEMKYYKWVNLRCVFCVFDFGFVLPSDFMQVDILWSVQSRSFYLQVRISLSAWLWSQGGLSMWVAGQNENLLIGVFLSTCFYVQKG